MGLLVSEMVDKLSKKRKCSGCGSVKVSSEFAKHSGTSDGFATHCNDCRNGIGERRRKTNPDARLKHMIATRVTKQLGNNLPLGLTRNLEKYLGYSIVSLRKHLEQQCRTDFGMDLINCINSGDYHIDHFVPLSSFQVNDPNSPKFKECWAISNLKVIPADVNLAKGAQVVGAYSDVTGMSGSPGSGL